MYLHATRALVTAALVTATESTDTDQWLLFGALVVVIALGLAIVVLVVSAVISIVVSGYYTAAGKCLWILMIIALPLLGALGWFIWGRRGPATILTADPRGGGPR